MDHDSEVESLKVKSLKCIQHHLLLFQYSARFRTIRSSIPGLNYKPSTRPSPPPEYLVAEPCHIPRPVFCDYVGCSHPWRWWSRWKGLRVRFPVATFFKAGY